MDWVDELVDHSEPPLLRINPFQVSLFWFKQPATWMLSTLLSGPDIISELPGYQEPFQQPLWGTREECP